GCLDEVTIALVKALIHSGLRDEGANLLTSYLTKYRRDAFPVRTELQRLAGDIIMTTGLLERGLATVAGAANA
ncbi:MAG TPA: hypothetical protein VH539_11675, partial [Gemmatimonadaceae bacterium]